MEKSYHQLSAGRVALVDEGEGEPLLLIHGIPTSSFLWRKVVPLLSRDHRVLAPDLLGYGDSEKPAGADLGVRAQARYVAELLEKLGWERGAVVGHDIGGGVAQVLAAENPEMVRALVLVDSIAYDSWPVPEIERLKEPVWDEIFKTLDLSRGFRKALERGLVRVAVDDELVEAYVRPFAGEGRFAYLRAARALRTQDLLDLMPRVEALSIPTLLLWGERDEFQKVEYARRLAAAMPRAKLRVIPEAGHFLPEDAPEDVASAIREFLQEESPGT